MTYGNYLAGHEPRILHEEILHELVRARAKFPRQNIWTTLAALTEKVGELNQDVLQANFEPQKAKTKEHVRKEAIQVAAMAMRIVLDCDLINAPEKEIEDLRTANAELTRQVTTLREALENFAYAADDIAHNLPDEMAAWNVESLREWLKDSAVQDFRRARFALAVTASKTGG